MANGKLQNNQNQHQSKRGIMTLKELAKELESERKQMTRELKDSNQSGLNDLYGKGYRDAFREIIERLKGVII